MNKKQNIYNYTILILLVLYNIVYRLKIIALYRNREAFITGIFFIILFILTLFMFGYAKSSRSPQKKKITRNVLIIVISGIVLTYCIGAFVGFQKNGYSLALINIVRNIFTPLIISIFMELFRYNIIRANKNKFKMIVLFTIILSILEIQMHTVILSNIGIVEIYILSTSVIIPIVAKNTILSYLSYSVGLRPCLIYRIFMELYIYFVPFLPKFGDYLNSMFGLILPLIVFINSSQDIDDDQNYTVPEFVSQKSKLVEVPTYALVIICIALISRVFPAFVIGIGSESMTGALNKGDAAFACRASEENIHENDIIVFQTQDKVLIHRVVEIENVDGIKYYRTKGDANGTRDNINVTIDKIYGKVHFRLPYLATPSVWLSEMLKKYS